MPVLTCPACESPLRVPENGAGLVHCPRCKELVGVPRPRSAGRPAAPAGLPEGVTQAQLIAAAIAGAAALTFFFFSCCGGLWVVKLLWPWR